MESSDGLVSMKAENSFLCNTFTPEASFVKSFSYRVVKRCVDIILSGCLLLILSPLFLVVGLLIKASSTGSVFYSWKVIGHGGRPFSGYKFRTMVNNADELKEQLLDKNEMNGPVFKMKDDPRITSVGKFLRKYSIDELPQLWSVLKGDMSLVGPRPCFPQEWEEFEPWQHRKLSVIPGITCLWQVNGRNRIDNFDEWVKLDLYYIDNWSLWLDMKILLRTVITVFRGTGM